MPITRTQFGTLEDGTSVECFTLENSQMRAQVLTYGATLLSLQIPNQTFPNDQEETVSDSQGQLSEILLGRDTLEGYLHDNPYFGAIVGRYANRIANAQFTLDGKTYRLPANEGQNHLHGGPSGFGRRVWHSELLPDGERLALSLFSPDGDEGYPGNLIATVVYTLVPPMTLRIDYFALADRPTVVNLTNHAYINLCGEGTILDHWMTMECDFYLPIREDLIPTGAIESVEGTPFDFRMGKPIGADIEANDPQLRIAGGYDHTFVIRGEAGILRRACTIRDPTTQRHMEVWTTEPGFQFYTMNLKRPILGRGGRQYERWSGFCIETQHFPDSPNLPHFPTTVLRPGEVYRSTTELRFQVG